MRSCRLLGRFLVTRPHGVNLLIANSKKLTAKARRPSLDDPTVAADLLLDFDFDLPAAASKGNQAPSDDDNVSYVDAVLKPLGKILLGIVTQIRHRDRATSVHALSDLLKAIIWIAPDPVRDARSGEIRQEDLWQWLRDQLLDSLSIVGSDLCLDMIRTLTARLRDARQASFLTLSKLLLLYTKKSCSHYPCIDVCSHLPLVWRAVSDACRLVYDPNDSLCNLLRSSLLESVVHSARGLLDPKVASSNSFSPYCRPHEGIILSPDGQGAFVEAKIQTIRDIKLSAIYFLGEHAVELASEGAVANAKPLFSSTLSVPLHGNALLFTPLTAVIDKTSAENKNLSGVIMMLLNAIWTEVPCYRDASLNAMGKIGLRLTNTIESPSEVTIGLLAFISSQLRTFVTSNIKFSQMNDNQICRLKASITPITVVINSFLAKTSPKISEVSYFLYLK